MRAVGLAMIGVCLAATAAMAQIEQQPLAPPSGSDEAAGEETLQEQGVLERSSRFKRAPFKTDPNQFGPSTPQEIEAPETVAQTGTRLRQLDKMTGAIQTVDVVAGKQVTLDRLTIQVETCRTTGDDNQSGAISFLKIWDARNVAQDPVFSGWMFAESPALSALDHPRYDVWVMNCIATSGGTPSANE
ncbi:MAG: DUF2155 domain-containing protein [Pseudomonadota bacterium]